MREDGFRDGRLVCKDLGWCGGKGGRGRAKCDGLGWDGGGERWGFWCQDVWEMLGSGILRYFGGGGVEGKM